MKFIHPTLTEGQGRDLLEMLAGTITDPITLAQPARTANRQQHIDFVKIARKKLAEKLAENYSNLGNAAKRACHIYLEIAEKL